MEPREKLSALRKDIDALDADLTRLFLKRMAASERIADAKAEGNIAITDEAREQQVLDSAAALAGDGLKPETLAFARTLISLSKLRQKRRLIPVEAVTFPGAAPRKQDGVTVAYQGVPGAWGEHAALQCFPGAERGNYDYFEDVFEAVKSGKADYGVLPIENSQTGAIGEVYGLLRAHGCYIVAQIWITVAQCLLAAKGTAISDIREVFSHPEGFSQCRRYLKNRNWDLSACRNTAYAAQMVAEKSGNKHAAIGSRRAAEVYGLSVLAPDIMDDANNKTRFIAIAAQPSYDEASDTTSVMFSTAHRSGALCSVLQAFMLAGINLSRIESRPVSADKYRFFADLQANLMSGTAMDALRQAAMSCEYFEILGCSRTLHEKPIQFGGGEQGGAAQGGVAQGGMAQGAQGDGAQSAQGGGAQGAQRA
ncbi:MAG: chorismate mutase [Clostridiales bacterium]|jgi:chorismate mutase/prephenate dehydratase|nr:chorismate mutase [Clostridiales bacterium]